MMMIHMITMSINVHLMMRTTVMTVHPAAMIQIMMVMTMNLTVFVMMVTQMMTTMVVMTV